MTFLHLNQSGDLKLLTTIRVGVAGLTELSLQNALLQHAPRLLGPDYLILGREVIVRERGRYLRVDVLALRP